MTKLRSPELARLTPLAQLRAGRLPYRIIQLFVGLSLFGAAMAGFVRSGLGLAPWDVLHYGVTLHTGLSLGTVVIIFGFLVLLLWIPLRQMPGLGTIANVIWIGLSADVALAFIPEVHGLPAQLALFAGSLLVNGLGGGLYIGSQLGPGPRDGLMTGLHARTGISLRLARTGVEVMVLVIGWFLGGIVGFGTIIYALAIGPLTQLFLRFCIIDLGIQPVLEETLNDSPAVSTATAGQPPTQG